MKLIKYIIPVLFFTAAFVLPSFTQDRTVIAGLESDSVYVSLIERENEFRSKEDSLNAKVLETRSLFRTDPDNRDKYADDILRLEGELFDIRNLLGITAGKLNSIEQEYIVRNLTAGNDPRQEGGSDRRRRYEETGAMLVFNPFFSGNLEPEDYATLVEAQKKEQGVADAINSFAKNYAMMAQIAAEMPLAEDKETADSLYSRYETLFALNEKYTQSISNDFGFIYDNKLYCYNYMLDKLGQRAQLAAFERKISETRDRAIAAGQDTESPEIAGYISRKSLLFDYEKTLAQIAGYETSLDSLSRAQAAFTRTDLSFPHLSVEEKLFLDFADIEFHNPPKYNSRTPVPDVTVHPKGEIYRILLGSFQRVQQVSILKGAYPVGVLQQDGRHNYYAGGYATLEGADAAVELLKGKGFRDPKIARWTNGEYKLLDTKEVDRLMGRATTGLFRLAIDTAGKPLPDVVKEILDDFDTGVEISRSGNLYIIGTFDSRDEASEIMEEIREETDGLDVKIEEVAAATPDHF